MAKTPSPNLPHETWRRLIATLLLVVLVIGIALATAITLSITVGWNTSPERFVTLILLGTTVGELAAFGLLIWRLHQEGRTLRDLGWGQPTIWWVFVLGIGIALLYSGYTVLNNPMIAHHFFDISWFKFAGLMAAIAGGFLEETLFRGYVMMSLNSMSYQRGVQVVLSGVFFALFHLYVFADPLSLLLVQGFTFVLGVALAITYLLGKRSLTPVIISHILVDLLLEPWLFLSFFGGR